ncbi:CPBP family glutamic-type intramembrane protease [Anaeromicropila herbilytica]
MLPIQYIEFIFVGFAEEIIYRGYFQTRLIAWFGTKKGCLCLIV